MYNKCKLMGNKGEEGMKNKINTGIAKKIATYSLSFATTFTMLGGFYGCMFFLGNAKLDAKLNEDSIKDLKKLLTKKQFED